MPKSQLETDALDLALLIYDLYKESQGDGIVTNGQNNAQQTQTN